MADIDAWLEGLGLGRYAELFRREQVTLGDLAGLDAARKAMEQLLTVYDEGRHFKFARFMDIDPKVAAQVYQSQTLWMLGFPDQARRVCNETVESGRWRSGSRRCARPDPALAHQGRGEEGEAAEV
ncbi:MAG: SAM domain-containing protein [Alphaproteobacteria bacterium]|jgi:hypothetical protein|nr:SAM domain-containing protein [Alphaproteobacteria bacterium]